MATTSTTAGDASNGLIHTAGDDGTYTIKTGAAGSKVNAVVFGADGTPTQIKGTTVGSAPTPVPSGSAPIYGARAWAVVDGSLSGSNAPTAGGNVSTVNRISTGNWTVTFTTAMPDANYAVIFSDTSYSVGNYLSKTTTGFGLVRRDNTFSGTNPTEISFVVFR